ncbi:MAG: hypothetical protein HXS48_02715 [Theionarchaea archaeon]|nr:hypothetical protein [Theionarchaea archaeon]
MVLGRCESKGSTDSVMVRRKENAMNHVVLAYFGVGAEDNFLDNSSLEESPYVTSLLRGVTVHAMLHGGTPCGMYS